MAAVALAVHCLSAAIATLISLIDRNYKIDEVAMSKLTLEVKPTFKLEVLVPVPGSEPAAAVFEMKHRKVSEFQEFLKNADKMADEIFFKEIVVGWDLSEEFSAANVTKLLQNYPQSAHAVGAAYVREYTRTISGN